MIKRIICAIWGHDTKNITIDDIFRIAMSQEERILAEHSVCKCARCGELAFLGRGIHHAQLMDLIQCTLIDLPRDLMEDAFSFKGLDVRLSNLYGLNNNKANDGS